jgi:outer membrane immunogenic protein
MKRLLIGSVAAVALSTAAVAVEMRPAFETLPPPAEAAPYNWTGLYGRMNTLTPSDAMMFGVPHSGSPLTPESFVGSTQFGYNYQFGSVVLGIEGEMSRQGGTGFNGFLGTSALDSLKLNGGQGWIGTLRPRAGLAADNWLFYGTGGLTYGSTNADVRSLTANTMRAGWTVGGGVEFAGGKAWSLGLEYLYADFSKSAQNQSAQLPAATPFSTPGMPDDRSQIVRGRLNYRFGWDGFSK